MGLDLHFEAWPFKVLVGGLSPIELPHLGVRNKEQGRKFILSYGFDLHRPEDVAFLWDCHQRAVAYIQSELLADDEVFPQAIADPAQLEDLTDLLIYASIRNQKEDSLQKWACATLKVMHVMVHLDNDIFNRYSSQIQDQILSPIQEHIIEGTGQGTMLGHHHTSEIIPLRKFAVKDFKRSRSSVTKLLAKPNEVAFALLDKLGVRFVTNNVFDSFRVMRYLLKQNILNMTHVISDQSNNTTYPLDLFLRALETLPQEVTDLEIENHLKQFLGDHRGELNYLRKGNEFTDSQYRFMKWIGRRLIHVGTGESKMSFFYPFEVQVIDYDSYLMSLNGPTSHKEYKKRQKRKARLRILGR